jgi:multisubunit Na+/H+ antiporter MnhB subunit
MVFRALADLILVTHAAFIAFIILGLALILLGGALGWRWVRNRWFRIAHLSAIGLVVLQAWLGVSCPLTVWENQLRFRAQQTTYTEGFIAHWLHRLIFFEAEPWVFTLSYTIFGLLVLATLWLVPMRWRRALS